MDQIQSYLHAGQTDDRVTDKDRAAFLVVDKTLGNLCLDIYPKQSFPIEKLYQYKKDMVSAEEPPARGFKPVPDGKSGNEKLGLECSYCPFKFKCYEGLKGYAYSRGPVWLTTIKREPDVPEIANENVHKV
jgi:hypothetical protein